MVQMIVALLCLAILLFAAVRILSRPIWHRDQVLRGLDSETPQAFSALPATLRHLHKCPHELKRDTDFEILPPAGEPLYVSHFIPLREDNMGFVRAAGRADWFPVAEGNYGQYCVEYEPLTDDPPVHYVDYDFRELKLVAPALSDFLSWPRRYRKRRGAKP